MSEPSAGASEDHQVLVTSDLPGPKMAVEAAGKALTAAGVDAGRLPLLLHAWIYHQEHEPWSPARYVARMLGAKTATAVNVQQLCSGGATAIELAVSWMSTAPGVEHVLVTTGDRFAAPGFARWNGEYDITYGDGGTALLLGRGRGPFSLLAVASTSEPQRGDGRRGSDAFLKLSATGLRCVVKQALDEAELLPAEISAVALPRFGSDRVRQAYLPTIASQFATNVQLVETGRHTGHLGAGDAAANLADLHATKSVQVGGIALLISGGTGFSWSCLIVRVEDEPAML